MLRVLESDDPRSALETAGPFLTRQPVNNNKLLTLLHERIAHPEPGRYWTVVNGDRPVGFGLQSPLTFSLGLSPMAPSAARALARHIAGAGHGCVPGLIAEAATAAAFAGSWSEWMSEPVVPVEGQRIYRLGRLQQFTKVPGQLRLARADESDLLANWWRAFAAYTGNHANGDPAVGVARDLEAGRLFVWDDDGPGCCARAVPPVAGVCRIGTVYTPPERRRRGYASACVGALCARVQNQYSDPVICMLYAQLANSTSNGIYRRLGFRAVAEVLQFRFGDSGT